MNNILVGCPTSTSIEVPTVVSIAKLSLPTMYISDSLVYEARNMITQEFLDGNYTHLLMVDSDMEFQPEDLDRLMSHDYGDVWTGLYVARKGNHQPLIYKEIQPRTKEHNCYSEMETDLSQEIIQVKGCGMGMCLFNRDIVERVIRYYGSLFEPISGLGEDLSACYKISLAGGTIYCDTKVQPKHNGMYGYTIKDWIKN